MPPKSTKKEEKPLWIKCYKCKFLVPQNKIESHAECKAEGIILGMNYNTFFTDKIYTNVPKEVEDIQSTYAERFILVPHAIATVCFFTMSNNLLIEFDGKSYVRNAWIVNNDEHIDRVYSTSKGMTQI